MPDITVHRHGDRWAVAEQGAESPGQEYPSREEAELAARQLADGGRVDVREDDPTGLAGAQRPGDAQPLETGLEEVDAVEAPERARSTQSGL